MIEYIVSTLYFIVTLLFSWNFIVLVRKLRAGSKKVNGMSLLATSSLIVTFLSLSLYFLMNDPIIVVASVIYLLGSMVFIKFFSKK